MSQKYKVFFFGNVLVFTDSPELHRKTTIIYKYSGIENLNDFLFGYVENCNDHHIRILCDNIEQCWNDFRSLFEVRRAAGGLVVNGNGDYLFIRRQGKWDIPKGHIEPGEQSRECAVREVTEECGISGLEIEKPICTTFHTYRLNERPILKSTDWYLMRCNDSEKLTPQTEEDITEAVWVAPSDIDNRLKDSFSSIPEIFKQLKIENWK